MSEEKEKKVPLWAEERPEEKGAIPSSKENNDEYIIPKLLHKIIDAINNESAQSAHHLDRIATALETIAKGEKSTIDVGIPTPPDIPKTAPTQKESPLDNIKSAFSTDLEEMLSFEDIGDYIKIKPRRFLGSDNFAKIASVVRSLGGEYISAGKDSHFKAKK